MAIFRYGLTSGKTMTDVIMDQHCHLTDLARYLMGEVKSLRVVKSKMRDARDYVAAVEFESGAVGTLNGTSGQIIEKEFLYFEMTAPGTFMYSHGCSELVWCRSSKEPWWKNPPSDYFFKRGAYGGNYMLETLGYMADVANFLAAVKGEEEDRSPIASTVGTMELCEEILRQMESY